MGCRLLGQVSSVMLSIAVKMTIPLTAVPLYSAFKTRPVFREVFLCKSGVGVPMELVKQASKH